MVSRLPSEQVVSFLVILALMFFVARIFGEFFRKLNQSRVMGELLGGILLGPSMVGTLFPDFFQHVFVIHKEAYIAFDGLARLGVMFLMFVAGMEVNLLSIRKEGRAAAKISFIGVFFPLVTGFVATWYFYDFLFPEGTTLKYIAALFIGVALSITALSAMGKLLIDLNLNGTRFGNLMITSAMIDDFTGWMLFSIIINLASLRHEVMETWQTVGTVILFTVLLLTLGRMIINQIFKFLNKYFSQPGSNITFAIMICLLGGVFTEGIGIHAVFGAFLAGVAAGSSKFFTSQARDILHYFITYILAPLFFVSLGMRVNFIENFDWRICLFILAIAFIGKFVGGVIGARMSRFSWNKSYAVGFAMNTRGSLEIVLGSLALQAKLINEKIFVGLVLMTFVSIVIAGPAISFFLKKHDLAMGTNSRFNKENEAEMYI
ncbi:MAG: cation:proton antiporter, partial [Bacteroidota bacterium]